MPRNLKCFFQDCDELAWAGLVLISWVPGAEILHVPCAAPMIAQTQNSNVLVLIWETYFTFFQDSGNVFVRGFFQQVNVFCFAMCKSHKFNKQGKKCASWIFYCPVQEPRIDVSPCCESASEPCGIEIQHGTYMHCDCDKTIPENKNKIGHVEVSQFPKSAMNCPVHGSDLDVSPCVRDFGFCRFDPVQHIWNLLWTIFSKKLTNEFPNFSGTVYLRILSSPGAGCFTLRQVERFRWKNSGPNCRK